MNYYFDNLSPEQFQQLINAILVKMYGEDFIVTPLRGSDGGKDGILKGVVTGSADFSTQMSHGRTIFQVKHHRIEGQGPTKARGAVLSEFNDEISKNIIGKKLLNNIDSFILITNVPASNSVMERTGTDYRIIDGHKLTTSIWWADRLTALLDANPEI